ncbi:DJ-1/PfpI family protein [Mycoplasma iguanae]|uniref:DJ-1/PfpI family protein n=1 Tax=Mycoplasma iguanae TaxID=292461 RepID=A0ABY5RA22_9MOLU|nr:DJ-1/PfpI family protein [Mycoplasma iguanae]UVD81465.1 DJ-1/PfpI family protein [Mycoplasma iguanae]
MKKLLVLVLEDFQDIELTTVLSTLDMSKTFSAIDFYNPNGLKEVSGQHKVTWVKINVEEPNLDEYEGIFIPGGKAAIHLRDDKKALELVKKFQDRNQKIYSICDAPNALHEKGIITDEAYVGYPISNHIKGENFKDTNSVKHENLFTSRCPFTSFDLAFDIIEHYQGKAQKELIEKIVKGIAN